MTTDARIATPTPERYVTRLCTHFAHKTDATWEGGQGRITFSAGVCTLDAEPGALVLRVTAADAEAAERLAGVVTRHLIQFAEGREDPGGVVVGRRVRLAAGPQALPARRASTAARRLRDIRTSRPSTSRTA